MNNIWVFGDSFSMDMNLDTAEFSRNYVSWKGRPVKNYADFIGEEFNCKVNNFAKGGNDNYTILQTICNNVHHIQKNDLIFIGWGPIIRFRLIDHKNSVYVIVNGNHSYDCIDLKGEEIVKLKENRDHDLSYQEIKDWTHLLKVTMKDNFIYDWCWWVDGLHDKHDKIWDETKLEVNDGHWSEIGHKDFSDLIKIEIKKWQDDKIGNRG